MLKKLIKPGILLATVFVVISLLFTTVGATTVEVLDGKVSVTDSANSNKVSGGKVTITAKGSLISKKTNNITITNETGNKAQLSFGYSADAASSFKIAGATAATSGSYSVVLEAGGSLSITLVSNSGFSGTTATLTLSNFILVAMQGESDVTFNFDSALGSITVGGEAVANGDVETISGTTGAALVATANVGSTFLGWVDAEGKIIDTAASYTLIPAQGMTVKAVFAQNGGTPWFGVGAASQKSQSSGFMGLSKLYYYEVGTSYLFDDLNEAATYAAANNTKAIVLMNNGTLPAGDYTIPAGVTLLIPFDAQNTLYTDAAVATQRVQDDGKTSVPMKVIKYRTLTLKSGANIVINGSMSLSAKHMWAQGGRTSGGSPNGNVSFVEMESGSNITVNNGGALYAYGYITGSGTVTAKSGSTVYEMFQIMDFRGGSQSTDMKNGVFPLSQYYVQNIEVPLTLYSGATESAYTTIYMSSADFGSSVNFIAKKDAMFSLTSGYIVKKYDGSTDRLVIEVYGELAMSAVDIPVSTSSINSKDYDLPINGNITVAIKKGSTVSINQDLALLPGSQFTIDEGATLTLGSGCNIYIYDKDQWGKYCGASNQQIIPLEYAPGKKYTRPTDDLVDASFCVNGIVDASAGYVYTTESGADIYSAGNGVVKMKAGEETVTYQFVQGTGYTEIPITPAKLKNADGKYVTPQVGTTFNYRDNKWHCETHTASQATCTEGANCDVCADFVSALGHTPGATATCTTAQLCNVCKAVLTAAFGHTPGDEATCTEAQRCTVCTEILKNALGHDVCWSHSGKTHTLTCSCGDLGSAVVDVSYRLKDYLWLNATVTKNELGATWTLSGAQYQDSYIIRAVGAAEIPNSLSLVVTYGGVEYPLEVNLAAYREMITNAEDQALIDKLLAYGEAAEDMFGNTDADGNVIYNDTTASVAKPDGIPTALTPFDAQKPSVAAGNVTVNRFGMTIGFDNCLQFIYGFKVNGATGITDWTNILEIGLLYSDAEGELVAQKSSSAYVLYQNSALVSDSANLPEGVTLQPVPKDSTLSADALAEMLKDNGCYLITYNMTYADYGKSYNYRPYILFMDGSVAYGEQFAYSLATYIGNRLGSENNPASAEEETLLYATWNLRAEVETWLKAKEGAAT